MDHRSILSAVLMLALSGVFAGCFGSKQNAVPLQPSSFYAPGSGAGERTPAAAQAPAAASWAANPAVGVAGDPPVPTLTAAKAPATQADASRVSLPLSEAQAPATQASAQLGASSGQYLIYGAVLATVYDRPIFADKVVRTLDGFLGDKAKEMAPDMFAAFAREAIKQERDLLIRNEILFVTSNRDLSDDDKKLANAITMKWRMDQIQACGGSVELARQRASAELQDFDDLVQEQYRHNMFQLYKERRILPRIQVSVNDMREYYT